MKAKFYTRPVVLFAVTCVSLVVIFPWIGRDGATPAQGEIGGAGCIAVHAAFDVGSSTTKVKVARIDRCENKILEVLLDETEPVGYQEDLQRSETNELSAEVRARGREVLDALYAAAQEHEPVVQVGVATSAFRTAANGEAFLQSLRDRTGIDLRLIDGWEEAMLGFHAAVAGAGVSRERAVVWDIGGGSMQVVALDLADAHAPAAHEPTHEGAAAEGDGEGTGAPRYLYYEGNTASVRFRDRIIDELQQRDLAQAQSPNPISAEVVQAALELSRALADDLPEPLVRRLNDPETVVVGIGGVHFFSIRGQLDSGDGPYRRAEVAAMLERRTNMTDEQIGGSFADTEVSNLILVLGHMEAWNIDAVHPVNVTMSDGLLLMGAQAISASTSSPAPPPLEGP